MTPNGGYATEKGRGAAGSRPLEGVPAHATAVVEALVGFPRLGGRLAAGLRPLKLLYE